ncbi:hypothetical protein [Nitrolancea hollandica]|uniref:Uncharacterized protein n=1 Tax=Nitrolancea hollandica Lb TaxID=1129897 RepID=I4EI19_9BACT|nr:hypothetical protein [Nitrolancea hollandica]CCF84331.1 hypothetical protein NITHO_3310048 [Nitrolancea hollandica Lb]
MMLYEFGLLRSPEQVFDFFKRYRREYLESLRAADAGNAHQWISLNRTAVRDWYHQRLYDEIRRDRRLRLRILPQINQSERQLMSRERRLTLELDANIRRSRQLYQRFQRLKSREYHQLTLELGE